MCHPLMEFEQEFLYQFFVRNVLLPSELNSNLPFTQHKFHAMVFLHLQRASFLKAFVKGVRGYFLYYLRRFSLCFCLNNAFQPVLSSQTATMVKKHFDFIICFALLNHKNSIRFVFLRMVILGWVVYCSQYLSYDIPP